MAVFAAIRGQHLCVPDLSLLQERGGNFRGKRDYFWESRADPWPCRVGRALPAREEHVPAPRSKPRGATNAENQTRKPEQMVKWGWSLITQGRWF